MKRMLFTAALLCLLVGAASADTERKRLVVADFEGDAQLAKFTLRGIDSASFTLSSDTPISGGKSARITYPKWKKGADQWPALILPIRDGLPSDWSGYDCFSFTVRNHSKTSADLAFHISDTAGGATSRHFRLDADETRVIRFPLYNVDNTDISRVRDIHIFSTRPLADTTFTVDDLHLEEDLDSRLSTAKENLKKFKPQCVLPETISLYQELDNACLKLDEQLKTASTVESRESLRPEVLALEENLRFRLPRAISEARMRSEFRKIKGDTPYSCGFASSMEKFFPRDIPFDAKVLPQGYIELAGNETESLQLLILAGEQELKDVLVNVEPLKTLDGTTLPASCVQVSPVGFVKTEKPPYHVPYIGWYPDPILDFLESFNVKPGELQPVWIRVKTPKGTPPGEYAGEITVKPSNAPIVRLGLRVKVWGFDLPPETHLRTAVNFSEHFLVQTYGHLPERLRQRYYDFLLEHRINPDSIYRAVPPKITDLLRWDRRGMNAFNLVYAVKPKDLKAGDPYPEEAKKAIMAKLDDIIPKLKEKGLYQKAYLYGFDEVNRDSFNAMKDIFSTIKAKYPDLPLLTTAYDATYGEASGLDVVDAWVPLTPKYDPERVKKARAKGKQVWWYICIVPKKPYANWLIEYDAIDARSLMGVQTAKYKPDGFLYYATNRWPRSKKPITDGPYTDWPPASFNDCNGDGSLICAGPEGPLATVRLENLRDGIEDYEYFWLLEQEIEKLKKSYHPQALTVLSQAQQALKIEDKLVRNLTDFSKSPDVIYAKRRQVAETITTIRSIINK